MPRSIRSQIHRLTVSLVEARSREDRFDSVQRSRSDRLVARFRNIRNPVLSAVNPEAEHRSSRKEVR